MTKDQKDKIEEKDLIEEMEDELEELEEEETKEENNDEEKTVEIDENSMLAKVMADFENFKKRTQRDKGEMIFFLKQDIFKKILPRLDDIERIVKNTPEELQNGVVFEGLQSLEKSLKKDLETLGVTSFVSVGEEVNPDLHDVMTTIPGKPEGIIADEFEKGYMLGDKVLRHAKVVAGAGE